VTDVDGTQENICHIRTDAVARKSRFRHRKSDIGANGVFSVTHTETVEKMNKNVFFLCPVQTINGRKKWLR